MRRAPSIEIGTNAANTARIGITTVIEIVTTVTATVISATGTVPTATGTVTTAMGTGISASGPTPIAGAMPGGVHLVPA